MSQSQGGGGVVLLVVSPVRKDTSVEVALGGWEVGKKEVGKRGGELFKHLLVFHRNM